MKFRIIAATALFSCFVITAVQAKVTSITDWNAKHNTRVSDDETDAARCARACSGYNSGVIYCPPASGKVLETCPEQGCNSFKRCAVPEPSPSEE